MPDRVAGIDTVQVIATELHRIFGGKIGYCYHEGDTYKRCVEDAKTIAAALAEAGEVSPSPTTTDDKLTEIEDWWLCAFHQDVPDFYCCQRERMPECVPVQTYFQRGVSIGRVAIVTPVAADQGDDEARRLLYATYNALDGLLRSAIELDDDYDSAPIREVYDAVGDHLWPEPTR